MLEPKVTSYYDNDKIISTFRAIGLYEVLDWSMQKNGGCMSTFFALLGSIIFYYNTPMTTLLELLFFEFFLNLGS